MLCSRTNTIQRRVIWSYSVIQKKKKKTYNFNKVKMERRGRSGRWRGWIHAICSTQAGLQTRVLIYLKLIYLKSFVHNTDTPYQRNEFQDHLGIPMASSVIFHKHMTHVPKEDFVRISLPQRVRGQLKELSWWFPSNLKPALFLV